MIKKIDDYYLNMPVGESYNLKELSLEEYKLFESVGIKKIFNDERIYHGKDINFVDAIWNVTVGATAGMIYKISLQNMSIEKNELDRIFKSAYDYLFKEMGKHTEYNSTAKRYVWDTVEGNIILDQASAIGEYGIQLFLTSSIIKRQPEKIEELYEALKVSNNVFEQVADINKRHLVDKFIKRVTPIYFIIIFLLALSISNFFTAVKFIILFFVVCFMIHTLLSGLVARGIAGISRLFKKDNHKQYLPPSEMLITEKYGLPIGAFFISLIALCFLKILHFNSNLYILFFLCLIINSIFLYLDRYVYSMNRSFLGLVMELLIYLNFLFRK